MVVVFDRWLTITRPAARTYRVAVWRRIHRARRGRSVPWSAEERRLFSEIGRAGA